MGNKFVTGFDRVFPLLLKFSESDPDPRILVQVRVAFANIDKSI